MKVGPDAPTNHERPASAGKRFIALVEVRHKTATATGFCPTLGRLGFEEYNQAKSYKEEQEKLHPDRSYLIHLVPMEPVRP